MSTNPNVKSEAEGQKEALTDSSTVVDIHQDGDEEASNEKNQNPAETPTETPIETPIVRRRLITRSTLSKPKSRFSEPPIPAATLNDEKSTLKQHQGCDKESPNDGVSATTPKKNIGMSPSMPKTQLEESESESEDDDEEEYVKEDGKEDGKEAEVDKSAKAPTTLKDILRKNLKVLIGFEWVGLVCITGTLISSLAINQFKHIMFSEFELWKWCVLLLVMVCGRLLAEGFLMGSYILIKKNPLLRKDIMFFLHKLKKSVQVCIWLAMVLLSWLLLFNGRIKRSLSDDRIEIAHSVTRGLVASLVGAVIWVIKTLLMTMLAASFNVNTFFDRIKESLIHQHVLKVLSPLEAKKKAEEGKGQQGTYSLDEICKLKQDEVSAWNTFFDRIKEISLINQHVLKVLSWLSGAKKKAEEGKGQQVTDSLDKIRELKQDEVSAYTLKYLFNQISTTKLFTNSSTNGWDDEEDEQNNINFTCEWEAKAAARRIFNNVVEPGCKYIYKKDLWKFFSPKDAEDVFNLFEGAVETGKIKKSMMRNWVVKVYIEHKALEHSLKDALKAVKQLNKIVSVLVLVVILVVWLVLMKLATTQVLIFISSQMFVYGHTAKTVFEGILFSFVTRPFDVGDRCVIDGVQMVVEEMSLLTTVFLRYDNEKIYYPNAVLATKSISNLYRSPNMGDLVEFTVDVSTSMESIKALKDKIKEYIEKKPDHWNRKHIVMVLEIENVNKMKMALSVTHTMNYQNMGEKIKRRSDLVFELKKIFEEIHIKYHLLPQEVLVSYTSVQPTTAAPGTVSTG